MSLRHLMHLNPTRTLLRDLDRLMADDLFAAPVRRVRPRHRNVQDQQVQASHRIQQSSQQRHQQQQDQGNHAVATTNQSRNNNGVRARYNEPFDDMSLSMWRDPFFSPALDVFSRLQRLEETMKDSLDMVPRMEIVEDEKSYALTLDIPGVRKEDVQIKLDDHTLSVTAEKKEEYEEPLVAASESTSETQQPEASQESKVEVKDDATKTESTSSTDREQQQGNATETQKPSQSTRKVRTYGRFYRVLELPDDADVSNITAKHEHGQLRLTVPKMVEEKKEPQTIQIQ